MAKKAKKTNEKQQSLDVELEGEYNDDVSIEVENIEKDVESKIKRLKIELEKCKKARQENLDGWQRSRADYANLQAEEGKKRAQIGEFVKEELLTNFLPVIDSFDMAMTSKDWEKVDKNWKSGIENIYNQFLSIFKDQGISEITEEDVLFDPSLHESVETVDTEKEKDDNKVVEIVNKGYKINSKVLRPARVKVYKLIKSS